MRWTVALGGFAAGLLASTLGASALAATSLSNSLSGFTGNSSQAGTQSALTAAGLSVFSTAGMNGDGTSNPAVAYDASGAHFGSLITGDPGRNYMRTVASDYATSSFTAEVTIAVTANEQATFFGLGSGDTALFGTPDWSTQASSGSFWPEPGNDKITVFKTANDVNAFVDKPVPGFDPGVHRLRMTFDAATGFLTGAIDLNYVSGPFVADATTLPIATKAGAGPLFAADGWPSEPSRIFFGGDDGAVFRNLTITVVPEPTTGLLFAVGGLVLLQRGRRRASAAPHAS